MRAEEKSSRFILHDLNINISRVDLNEYLYIIALFMFEAGSIMELTFFTYQNRAFPLLIKLVRYLAYFICLICLYYKKTEINRLFAMILFVSPFLLSYVGSHNQTMVLYSILFIAAAGVSSEKIVKCAVYVQGAALIVFPLLSQLGVVMDYVYDPSERERHCLGFLYTTFAPILFFHFALGVVFLMRRRISVIVLLLLEAVNYYFYVMTDTAMTFYTLTLFLFILLMYRLAGEHKHVSPGLKCFFLFYPAIMMAVSVAVVMMFDPEDKWWLSINEMVHHRIALGYFGMKKYGVSLFGKEIEWIGSAVAGGEIAGDYNYVDSSYMQLLYNYGVVFITAVLIIYVVLIYISIKNDDFVLCIIYLAILTLALSEPRLMHLTFNCFPLLLFSAIPMCRDNRFGAGIGSTETLMKQMDKDEDLSISNECT